MNYLSLCKSIGKKVQVHVDKAYGKKSFSREIGMGAGGDRTMRFDKLSENIVLRELKKLKNFYLISEEFGEKQFGYDGPTILVDPIDGSKNFKRTLGNFAVSIGIAEGKTLGDMAFGYIRNLHSRDEYWATKGKGAFKNGKRIRTAKGERIEILGMDFAKGPFSMKALPLVKATGSARDLGSIAASLSLFSEGKFDAYVIMKGQTRVLDIAAGYLIAKEAGAKFSDFNLKSISSIPLSIDKMFSFIAGSNKETFSSLSRTLRNK